MDMRLKNLSEKAHDRKKLKNASAELMESLDSFFIESEDKIDRGYFLTLTKCAYMLGTVFEDHCSVKNAQKQVKQRFVADLNNNDEADWKNTTSIWVYKQEDLHAE